MPDDDFTISSAEWAERVFPGRFKEAAKRRHGYKEGDSESKLVSRVHKDLSRRFEVSTATVSRWLGGKSFPKPDKILAIADAYDVSPNYLVGNTDANEEGFSLAALEARIPYEKVLQVLRIMSEIRGAEEMSNERFAESGVKMLQMVERDPDMSQDAIIGAAYRMLKASGDTTER